MEQWKIRGQRMDDFIRVPRYVDGEISEDRPQLRQGQEVALKGKPGKVRKVLHAEWHYEIQNPIRFNFLTRSKWVSLLNTGNPC